MQTNLEPQEGSPRGGILHAREDVVQGQKLKVREREKKREKKRERWKEKKCVRKREREGWNDGERIRRS